MKVLIDPGHGGKDPGAFERNCKESQLNLRDSLTLASMVFDGLGKNEVYLTRYCDCTLDPVARKRLIQNIPHDVFLCIHHNAGPGNGFESFIKREPTEAEIRLQIQIHSALRNTLAKYGMRDRGPQRKNFRVLTETTAPGIFLELGFMPHQRDWNNIINPLFKTEVYYNIAGVIRNGSYNTPSSEA